MAVLDWGVVEFWAKNRRHLACKLIVTAGAIFPAALKGAMFKFLLSFTPVLPVTLRRGLGPFNRLHIFIWSFFIAFFCCFVVTGFLNYLNGSLWGKQFEGISFLEDQANLILYSSIVPLYIGCASVIISIFIENHIKLVRFSRIYGNANSKARLNRFPVFIFSVLVLSSVLTYNYITDILSSMDDGSVFWFAVRYQDSPIFLSKVGVYYAILNFVLLFFVLITGFCFFALFFEAMNLGMSLKDIRPADKFDSRRIESALLYYAQAYLWVKLIAIVLCLNIIVWQRSPLAKTDNLNISIIAIAALGIFFVSFPRYYIEIMWRSYLIRSGQRSQYAEFESVGDSKDRTIALVVDSVLTIVLVGYVVKDSAWGKIVLVFLGFD